jgi:YesN/AraC family two-component response regulator
MQGEILLVDDNKDFRSEFKDGLEEYEVVEAGSGEEALTILSQPNEIELVILDFRMPGLTGTETLKKIKKITPDASVIILTGYSSKELAIEALRCKSDDFLEKPLDLEKAREIIEKIMRAKITDADLNGIGVNGKIERVKNFVKKNCHKSLSLKDASDLVFISPKYLSRIFKQHTGISFSRFRLDSKIEKAKELLVNTEYKINKIAYKMGFQNAESFMRSFKKLAKCTPTEYRQKYK